MLAGAGFEHHLIYGVVHILRQHGLKDHGGARLEAVLLRGGRGGDLWRKVTLAAKGHRIDGQELLERRDDGDGIDEVVEEDDDLLVLAGEEHFLEEAAHAADFGELRRVLDREIGQQGAAQAVNDLDRLFADGDVLNLTGAEIGGEELFEEIRIQSAAEAFVTGDEQDERFVAFAFGEEGMSAFLGILLEVHEHLVQQLGVVTAVGGLVLRLFHLRSRDELHGLGDLGRVFDRFDSASDVASGRHGAESLGLRTESQKITSRRP